VRCKLNLGMKVSRAGEAKASPNRAIEYRIVDPKLSDLSMVSAKLSERSVEVRTLQC
jgi:hypothetical protein